MAAPTDTPDPVRERAQLAERLLLHLQGSIEVFQRDVLASIQTEFWSGYIREPGATLETMDAVFAHQTQLVTDLCDQMHGAVVEHCTPLAQMVTQRVPGWARALQVEAERGVDAPLMAEVVQTLTPVEAPEKTLTPVVEELVPRVARSTEPRSWHAQWRERHGVTVPSRHTYQRRGAHQARTQEHTRGQGYRD